jgi:hypothetical protein
MAARAVKLLVDPPAAGRACRPWLPTAALPVKGRYAIA